MNPSHPKPAHATWVSPYITVRDVDQAAEFYNKAFQFGIKELAPGEDNTTWHAELIYKDQLIMLGKEGAWGGVTQSPASSCIESPINLYLYTENVDKFYKHALANRAQGIIAPDNMFWGDRMCQLKDPDGYIWCFATHL